MAGIYPVSDVATPMTGTSPEAIIYRDQILGVSTWKSFYPDKDPVISKDRNKLVGAMKIGDTVYYSEGVISSARARIYAKQLLDLYELTDDIGISVQDS